MQCCCELVGFGVDVEEAGGTSSGGPRDVIRRRRIGCERDHAGSGCERGDVSDRFIAGPFGEARVDERHVGVVLLERRRDLIHASNQADTLHVVPRAEIQLVEAKGATGHHQQPDAFVSAVRWHRNGPGSNTRVGVCRAEGSRNSSSTYVLVGAPERARSWHPEAIRSVVITRGDALVYRGLGGATATDGRVPAQFRVEPGAGVEPATT